jgi:hypothetical protein
VVRSAARAPAGSGGPTISGTVYHDQDRDSSDDRQEAGVPGVLVSNGREVVKTDANGDYRLPAYEGMTGVRDQAGGLGGPAGRAELPAVLLPPPAEGLAAAPLRRTAADRPAAAADQLPDRAVRGAQPGSSINCAVIGDTQTYSNQELGFLRDGSSTTSPSGTTSASAAPSSSVTWPATTSASTRGSRRS